MLKEIKLNIVTTIRTSNPMKLNGFVDRNFWMKMLSLDTEHWIWNSNFSPCCSPPGFTFVPHANLFVYITDDGMWTVQMLGACEVWGVVWRKIPGAELSSRICWVHLQVCHWFCLLQINRTGKKFTLDVTIKEFRTWCISNEIVGTVWVMNEKRDWNCKETEAGAEWD